MAAIGGIFTGADLAVLKSGPAQAAAGTDVSYDITLTNMGPDPAASASVTDPLPVMTFVSITQTSGPAAVCSDPGAGANGTVTCTIASLAVSETATFTLVAHIPPSAAPNDVFTNLATASAATFDPNEENNTGVAVTMVPGPPGSDVSVSKQGPSGAPAGSDVTYVITVTNTTSSPALQATLTDTLPGSMTFVSFAQNSGPAFTCNPFPPGGSGGTISCSSASMAGPATSVFTLVTHIPVAEPGGSTFTNTANVSATNDSNPDNDSSSTVVTVGSADLALTKSAGAPTALAGNNIIWTVSITNNGPDIADVPVLNDPLPPEVTFVSLVQTVGPPAICSTPAVGTNGNVNCALTLAPAATSTFAITTTVNTTVPNGTIVSNTATVTADSGDPNGANNQMSATVLIGTQADASVVKTGPAGVTAGQNATFTITVTNAGPSNAQTVVLSDAVPPNTTFVSMTQTSGPTFACATPAPGGIGTATCTNASLAPTTAATFSFVVKVNPSATGSIVNTATVTTTTSDLNNPNNTSTATVPVTASADLAITKTGPANVSVAQNATFTITVTNNGPSDAQTVTLSDTVPVNTTFVSMAQTSGAPFVLATPAVGGTGTATGTAAILAAGTSATFTFVVNVNGAATGSIANTASVSAATTDPANANNSATATVALTPVADVAVTKTGPASVPGGANVTFTISVTNNGPSTAQSISLTDVLPANTTFVSITQTAGPAFTLTTPGAGATGTVTATAASMLSGVTATFSLVLKVASGATGSITNTATVSTTTADPAAANNTATATVPLTVSSDLAVTKSGPAAAAGGQNVPYVVTVTNNGPSDAQTITLTDTLPANSGFVSMAQTSGPAFTCTSPGVGATGTVTCTGASLPSGSSASFLITVNTVPALAGTLTNSATVSSVSPDPNPANNAASATTTISAIVSDLSITKTASAARIIPSSPLTYTITVTNAGPDAASGVTVTDTLPATMTFVSATPSQGSCSGTSTVTCNLGTLANGANATITINVQSGTTLAPTANTATVTSSSADSNLANNTSTANVAIVQDIPALSPMTLLLLAGILGAFGAFVLKR